MNFFKIRVKLVQNLIIFGLMMLLLKYMLFDNEMGAYYVEEFYESALILGSNALNYFGILHGEPNVSIESS
jgi:hypothetical protein